MRAVRRTPEAAPNLDTELIKTADAARDARHWRQAATAYNQYLARNPENFAIWVQLGHVLKEFGEFASADTAYDRAEKLNPLDADLLLNRGHLKKIGGDYGAAFSLYQRSFELDRNPDAQREMATLSAMPAARKLVPAQAKRAPKVNRAVAETIYFDPAFYRQSLAAKGSAPGADADLVGIFVANSDLFPESPNILFDTDYYLRQHEDAQELELHPFEHFVVKGDREGRSPSFLFDAGFVSARYGPDIFNGPLYHYLSRGGRTVDPVNWFDSAYYAKAAGFDRSFPYSDFLARLPTGTVAPNALFSRFLEANPALQPRQDGALAAGSPEGGIDVIIPHFRNPVCAALSRLSLLWLLPELQAFDARVLLVNDSPDDAETTAILQRTLADLAPFVDIELATNSSNLGFVKSTNLGLERARAARRHALLLNSDAFICPGALREMLAALHADPMTGFVSPRTNNATIATWPTDPGITKGWSLEEFYAAHEDAAPKMERFAFVPMVVGFCLLVRWDMLAEFGTLDEKYGKGYYEENDLIMRAAGCGYRSVLANRAYAFHIGKASFGKLLDKDAGANERLFLRRFPEFPRLIESYFKSVAHRIDALSLGTVRMADQARLRPIVAGQDRRALISLDLAHLGEYHNGTFASVKQLIGAGQAAWLDHFAIRIVAPKAAARFHGLDRLDGFELAEPDDEGAAAAVNFRYGQPFQESDLHRVGARAARVAYMMLDTIVQDCSYLHSAEVERLWNFVADTADGLVFNSSFTRAQFLRRYPAASVAPSLVSHHSLTLADYGRETRDEALWADGRILILGNHYKHKFVGETLGALSKAFPERQFTAMWDRDMEIGRARILRGGDIDADKLEAIEQSAAIYVIPSHYEGFGLNMFRGLALGREVFVRDSALVRELVEAAGGYEGLHLYKTTADLIAGIAALPTRMPPRAPHAGGVQDWHRSAAEIGDFLQTLIDSPDQTRVARRLRVLDDWREARD